MGFERGDVIIYGPKGYDPVYPVIGIIALVPGEKPSHDFRNDRYWMWCTNPLNGVTQDGMKWALPENIRKIGHVDLDSL